MIVYGDPRRRVLLSEVVEDLQTGLAAVAVGLDSSGSRHSLDLLRRTLIGVGSLEQAVHDAAEGGELAPELVATAEQATDAAARLFWRSWELSQGRRPVDRNRDDLTDLSAALAGLAAVSPAVVEVKTPEGFAFYTLYPEQYCAAALSWSAANDDGATDRRVVVVGVRSIGTTLSAVVLPVLSGEGWQPRRMTVRPHGPSSSRQIDLLPEQLRGASRALVVDEGPGVSGSSMAAVAAGLVEGGLEPKDISFLPSHPGEPGFMSSDPVRNRWAATSRHVVPLTALRWHGLSVPEILAAATMELCAATAVEPLDDLGGGRWRAFVYARTEDWPAVCAPFERTKYRCRLVDGSAVMWTFAGSDEERIFRELLDRSTGALSPRPLGAVHGFVAMPWVEAPPLRAEDGTPEILAAIARYIRLVSGPELPPSERAAALSRLAEMLYWNVWEALGPGMADRTRPWSDLVLREELPGEPTYGDGRMAPHEWRIDRDGQLWKLDPVGHERDHTVVGPQSVAWDIAGTLVEWRLSEPRRAVFLGELADTLRPPSAASIGFHELAYAAFRLGQMVMSDRMTGDDEAEKPRLAAAAAGYRDLLASRLDQGLPGAPTAPVPFTHQT